jgi:hypothetical protein
MTTWQSSSVSLDETDDGLQVQSVASRPIIRGV